MPLPGSGTISINNLKTEYSPTTPANDLGSFAKYLGKTPTAAQSLSEYYGKSSPHGVVAIDSTTPGSGTLTVPHGVTQARVYAHGGGGGGGGTAFYPGFGCWGGGGGGSGGRNAWPQTISVTGGTAPSYRVGAGGANGGSVAIGVPGGNGSPGESSFFSTATAGGGGGGMGGVLAAVGAAGAGGSPNGVAGTVGQPGYPSNAPAPGGSTGYGAGDGGRSAYMDYPTSVIAVDGSAGRLRVEWV